MTSYASSTIWLIVLVAALGTWLLRLSFIALLGKTAVIPESVTRLLGLIPAAVLAAIVTPALTHATGSFDLGTARFSAGVVAALVAWRTKNVMATIGVGMAVLWAAQALL